MVFNVDRMGENYVGVTGGWLASIVTISELNKVGALKVGESVSFPRGTTTHPTKLVATRVS